MFHWERTFESRSYDFTAELNGKPIGRIYRHNDHARWQYFAWLADGTGQNGVCETREEAIAQIERLATER